MKIRVGSRASKLAVIQAEMVMDAIVRHNPDIEVELVKITTTGDKILDRTLDKVGGKGLFVKELDRALLDKTVDITVHSFKDVPMEVCAGLPIVAVSKREAPFDVLVLPQGKSELDFSLPIGCASSRRAIQISKLFPECTVAPVRGNVITRLAKLDGGEYSALVLAEAGLRRLQLEERISRIFSAEELLPSACQGVLAVQAREDFDVSILGDLPDADAWDITIAERAFVRQLNGGCSAPTAAYGLLDGDDLILTGFFVGDNGLLIKKTAQGKRKDGEKLGIMLAKAVLEGCE